MQAGKQQLLEFLDNLGISVETFTHKAVFHVEEGRDIKENIPGAHTKNLFLKDKKGHYFLVTLGSYAILDLKHLHEKIAASGRLSFGSPEKLAEYLWLCHPMTNEATTSINRDDLIKFVRATNHEPHIIQVSEVEA